MTIFSLLLIFVYNAGMNVDERKIHILWLIVKTYIESGAVTWSKSLVKDKKVEVSSATVRNDMKSLEDMWLIYQPYNSAGRLPTTHGLRMYVDYLMQVMNQNYLVEETEEQEAAEIEVDVLHEMVMSLGGSTDEIAFVYFPKLQVLRFWGLSGFLQKHSSELGENVFPIIDSIENRNTFARMLDNLDVPLGNIRVFIGEENILPELSHCSLMIKKIVTGWQVWMLWLLASRRTDYAFNVSALRGVFQ